MALLVRFHDRRMLEVLFKNFTLVILYMEAHLALFLSITVSIPLDIISEIYSYILIFSSVHTKNEKNVRRGAILDR